MPSKPTIPRVCRQCGVDFLARPNEVRLGKALYCSHDCRLLADRIRKGQGAAEVSDDGVTARIQITAADGSHRAYVLVDAADAEWASQWTWHINNSGYAVRGHKVEGRSQDVRLHRELLGLPRKTDGREGDHIDRDKLNNRRGNLRVLTQAGNAQNVSSHQGASSQHRGVSWNTHKQRWHATVGTNGRTIFLGAFTDEIEAAAAARAGRERYLPHAVEDGAQPPRFLDADERPAREGRG